MYISATRDKEGGGLESIPIERVLFLETSQNRILVHTSDAVYYVANTLERWLHALRSAGQPFEQVDRCCVADLSKVKELDAKWSRIYFSEGPLAGNKPCNVARSNFRMIAKKVNQQNDPGLL
ncbi:LytTR family transcriptional regulator DNA-binding domain-containing protein [Paenibacillus sp. IB182496]|uniref:LytTR family transcriptional regulator DNA-binding domain-containing protein n=1 Tax=Paenibacillus sabuli TaxID=2772509 RepID=A0A927BTZ3_9BACL|nr:LytTR family transcriptional regulator DNA-binding domain-containing protein [Paenibacillus sabuli]MBD2845720.1 LytTR family transcriptional regulator DNA-binding domain-containing protein [Paenibacillus sabuli]